MDTRNKFQQPCAKGLVSDGKKAQDGNISKPPKSSRRRESPGSNSFPKNEPRKFSTQKTKAFEKRTKSKGHYYGSAKEDSKIEDKKSVELGSDVVPRNRKQNHNHLLNFYHAPRDVWGGWNHGIVSGYQGHHHYYRGHHRKYSKDDFLQTNCQFVVTAKGDYSHYFNNPDVLVDWKLIQQIRLHSTDNLSCPICLHPPVAGKITRCGHVYCWACILHFLSLSDKSWRACPICDEIIKKSELKSVVEITEKVLNIGDTVTLRLMRKENKKLIAMPVREIETLPRNNFITVAENNCKNIYSKLILADDQDIMDFLEMEKVQLEIERDEDPNSSEVCFIEQALNALDIRKQSFETTKIENETMSKDDSESKYDNCSIQQEVENCNSMSNLNEESEINFNAQNEFNSVDKQDTDVQDKFLKSEDDVNMNVAGDKKISPNPRKFYYFYQADDGQNIFLDPMNVKMLEMQYGNLENCPHEISGKLVDKIVDSISADTRKRLKYLSHLPIASQYEIVEIDLQPPYVTPKVLEAFGGQIRTRKENRDRRENEERKREKKITEEENKLMGKYPTANIHIESRKDFPQFQPDDELNAASPTESTAGSSVASSPSASWFDEAAAQNEDVNQLSAVAGPSYAQKLQTSGSRKSVAWPTLSTSKKSEPQLLSESRKSESSDNELEEYTRPKYLSLADYAFVQTRKSSDFFEEGGKSGGTSASTKKKKKKGKSTFTPLFFD